MGCQSLDGMAAASSPATQLVGGADRCILICTLAGMLWTPFPSLAGARGGGPLPGWHADCPAFRRRTV